jgi:hypothetical protein
MKHRIFIIGPTEDGKDLGDTLYIVAKTTHRDSLLDIYQTDRYQEIFRTGNVNQAIQAAKKEGAKRPTII